MSPKGLARVNRSGFLTVTKSPAPESRAGAGTAEEHSAGGFSRNKAIGVLGGLHPALFYVRRERAGDEQGIDAGDDHFGGTAADKLAGVGHGVDAADVAAGEKGGVPMEAGTETLLNVAQEARVEAVETPRTAGLSEHEQQRRVEQRMRRDSEALLDSRDDHAQEPFAPAPAFFKWHGAADEPIAVVHEASLLKAGDADADGGAGRGGIEADAGDHAGAENGDGRHAVTSSFPRSASLLCTSLPKDE